MDEVDGFSHRESRYTKYYKLVIFIVDTIFILSLVAVTAVTSQSLRLTRYQVEESKAKPDDGTLHLSIL
jgi:hypothetical protein